MKRMLIIGLFLGGMLNAKAMGFKCSNQNGTNIQVTYNRLTQVEITKDEIKSNYVLGFNDELFFPDFSEPVGSLKIKESIKIPSKIDFENCGRTRIGCGDLPTPISFWVATLTLDHQTETLTCLPF